MALINEGLTANSEKTLPLNRQADLEWMIAKEWIELVLRHRDKTLSSSAVPRTRLSKKTPKALGELGENSWTVPNMNWDSYLVERLGQISKP